MLSGLKQWSCINTSTLFVDKSILTDTAICIKDLIKDFVTALSCKNCQDFLVDYIILAVGGIFTERLCFPTALVSLTCAHLCHTGAWFSCPIRWTGHWVHYLGSKAGGKAEEVIPEQGHEPATSLFQSAVVNHSGTQASDMFSCKRPGWQIWLAQEQDGLSRYRQSAPMCKLNLTIGPLSAGVS